MIVGRLLGTYAVSGSSGDDDKIDNDDDDAMIGFNFDFTLDACNKQNESLKNYILMYIILFHYKVLRQALGGTPQLLYC